jgi:hypothetical protein
MNSSTFICFLVSEVDEGAGVEVTGARIRSPWVRLGVEHWRGAGSS